jgi:hypothetical protein
MSEVCTFNLYAPRVLYHSIYFSGSQYLLISDYYRPFRHDCTIYGNIVAELWKKLMAYGPMTIYAAIRDIEKGKLEPVAQH